MIHFHMVIQVILCVQLLHAQMTFVSIEGVFFIIIYIVFTCDLLILKKITCLSIFFNRYYIFIMLVLDQVEIRLTQPQLG